MKGCLKLQADRRADLKLDRLAESLGFTTKNAMLRHLANELSLCKPRHYWKAVGSFAAQCERKTK